MRRRLPLLLLALAPLGLLLAGCSGGGAHDVDKLLADLANEATRSRAERTLAEHGRSVIKPLSNLLTLKDIEKTVNDYGIRREPATLRAAAAEALGVIAAKASLAKAEAETAAAPLLEVLKGSDRGLRIAAARALGHFTQLSAPANDLVLTFRGDDAELAAAATEALARNALRAVYTLAPPQEPPAAAAEKDWGRLLERIASTDDDIRLDTVRELAASRDPRAADLLLQRVAEDKARDVRYAALCHCLDIAKSGQPAGFAEKLHALLPTAFAKDDDSRVALLAARQLQPRAPGRVAAFLDRIAAATARCREKLFGDALDRRLDAGARADAIEALVLLPSAERDAKLADLLDPAAGERARVKRAAAGVLATSESDTALEALRKAMGDADSIVKLVAAQALGRKGDLEAVKYLVDLLGDDETKIRADASDGLGTLGAKAVPVLVTHLRGALDRIAKNADERRAKYTAWGIVAGLGRIAEQIGAEAAPALDPIALAAECSDPDVRRVAAVALAQFKDPQAIAALARRLQDPDESVQWHAGVALEAQGPAAQAAFVAALRDDATLALAAGALGRIGDAEALPPLLDRLATAPDEARAEVLWGIGELLRRHPSAPQAAAARKALETASQQDADSEAARAAGYALQKIAQNSPRPD